ncbi:MAG: hypothetical protein LJE88_18950 [Deltaproteobacteria bacterium]|nr:hypothetical protein [Deltaproteobacteria bacterium]
MLVVSQLPLLAFTDVSSEWLRKVCATSPAVAGGAPGPPKRGEGGNREGVLSPGHSWARSDQTASPGTTEETSVKGTFIRIVSETGC